jgi:hypothetical protein
VSTFDIFSSSRSYRFDIGLAAARALARVRQNGSVRRKMARQTQRLGGARRPVKAHDRITASPSGPGRIDALPTPEQAVLIRKAIGLSKRPAINPEVVKANLSRPAFRQFRAIPRASTQRRYIALPKRQPNDIRLPRG